MPTLLLSIPFRGLLGKSSCSGNSMEFVSSPESPSTTPSNAKYDIGLPSFSSDFEAYCNVINLFKSLGFVL
ncbi:hypothetical protein PVK06_017087 [Gossypium arboreum]|uniref:Uncharacterized protein n=1 Tax=Gossypium arboreum TaxID=29729 RepID=A0ABR0Q2J7_GOSAR|nr:hypothetical protein PVK06_017087 [Gossypium arboreum]